MIFPTPARAQILAYIGAAGMKAKRVPDDEVVLLAAQLFGIPAAVDIAAMAQAVTNLGIDARRSACRAYRKANGIPHPQSHKHFKVRPPPVPRPMIEPRRAPARRVKIKPSQSFYDTDEWREVRYRALVLHGGACQCCGSRPSPGKPLHVDHIKPRSKFPELEIDIGNLQVLCKDCNLGKRAWDQTDWRGAGICEAVE